MNKAKAKEFWEKNKGKIMIVGGIAVGTALVAIGYKKGVNFGKCLEAVPEDLADTEYFSLFDPSKQYWKLADLGKFGEQLIENYAEANLGKESLVKSAKVFIKMK